MATIAVLDQNTIDKLRPVRSWNGRLRRSKGAGGKCNGRRCDGDHNVEIRDGGISLVRITDNGSGIPAEQVPLAFCATRRARFVPWKNSCRLHLLGFRGEALSSISAVAQIEMITKTPDALTGTRYVIEAARRRPMRRSVPRPEQPSGPDLFTTRRLVRNS